MHLHVLKYRSVRIGLIFFFLANVLFASEKPKSDVKESAESMSYTVLPGQTLEYKRPKAFEFFKHIPRDYKSFFKNTFRKNQLIYLAGISASTAILIVYDQPILDGAKSFGKTLHLAGTSNQTPLIDEKITLAKKEIKLQFNVPTDVNSTFYYLGDGWTHTSIALAFWVSGLITKDYRSLRTASELGECILTTGIATQFIKHLTGRQSPYTTDVKGGVWHFFPNQKNYADHVPQYDAFPTGHLATAMATVTVIAENYPEKKYIRPVGYTLMGLLGFSMLNNGVHWISDYPLGIAMGYSFAKIAVSHGRTTHTGQFSQLNKNRFKLAPSFAFVPNTSGVGLGVRWNVVSR